MKLESKFLFKFLTTFLTISYQIHHCFSSRILDKFAQDNESKLIIEYMISSKGDNDSNPGMFVVSKDELESKKASLKNATIYPYSIRSSEYDESSSSVLNFEKFFIDDEDFVSIQKYGKIHNERISTRPNRRTVVPKANIPKVESVKKPQKPVISFPKREEPKVEPKVEPKDEVMEDEENNSNALKDVNLNVRRTSPRKRPSKHDSDDEIDGDLIKKKRKRVIIEDSDDDGDFITTKIKTEVKEEIKEEIPEVPKTVPKNKISPSQDKKVEKAKAKPAPKGQKSIMSFFKKA